MSKRIIRAIKEVGKVIVALSDLGLKVGTLVAIIKMIVGAIN
ncbi:hypothetical protein AGMMS49975_18590 [Clostridia bacterium]|nr:hypothetical protein AGMMS49975_18590 [Clostridia bacterium]